MAVPGDVEINKCMIDSPRGSLDLNKGFLSARVYESIMTQNNILELDVFDCDDALGELEVKGDETITFNFNAPGTPIVNYVFSLDKVEIADSETSPKSKTYIVHGVGKETMYSKANYVQKAYNTDIASIVEDIHKTFLKSVNKIAKEVTDGIQKIIIPNLRPFEAIDMVRRRATSTTNKSSTFLYFENADGHNFKTIEGMMKEDVVKTFVRSDAVGSSIYINTWNNIINYQVPKIISSTERIGMGGLTQRVGTYDPRTRKYKQEDKKMDGGNFNSDIFKNLYGITHGLFHLLPFNTGIPKTFLDQAIPNQTAYLSKISQCQITLLVNGDTTVKAGDMIQVNIPKAATTTGDRGLDPLLTNKYLVNNICRHIDKIDVTPRYTDILDCNTDTQGQSDSSNGGDGTAAPEATSAPAGAASTPATPMVQGVTHN